MDKNNVKDHNHTIMIFGEFKVQLNLHLSRLLAFDCVSLKLIIRKGSYCFLKKPLKHCFVLVHHVFLDGSVRTFQFHAWAAISKWYWRFVRRRDFVSNSTAFVFTLLESWITSSLLLCSHLHQYFHQLSNNYEHNFSSQNFLRVRVSTRLGGIPTSISLLLAFPTQGLCFLEFALLFFRTIFFKKSLQPNIDCFHHLA